MKPVWIDGNKIDWQRSELITQASTTSIEPKILAVLKVLVEANGDVVSQQLILDAVWKSVVVAPNALQRCIAQLRKLFSDDAKTQKSSPPHLVVLVCSSIILVFRMVASRTRMIILIILRQSEA